MSQKELKKERDQMNLLEQKCEIMIQHAKKPQPAPCMDQIKNKSWQ